MASKQPDRDPTLYNDIFQILEVNPDGKKFDKVTRYRCRGTLLEMDLVLDINTDIYPINPKSQYALTLAHTLQRSGAATEEHYGRAMQSSGSNLLSDDFEYVMHGRIFKLADKGSQAQVEVYISFGGLLMQLTGEANKLRDLVIDTNVFLLMRSTS
ncbi:hypothetical protein WJX73_001614 [Symbiochloris irregularis]|uniref:DNA-directed RNA polymerases I, II, and III subunit RPABC3 n=1 Tax=Symbiochloris irregularis TaxID=706552 RepID=A0AAW1PUA2_9CHLO